MRQARTNDLNRECAKKGNSCDEPLRTQAFYGRMENRRKANGRLAQRERRSLTRTRSQVQILYRPPCQIRAIELPRRWPARFHLKKKRLCEPSFYERPSCFGLVFGAQSRRPDTAPPAISHRYKLATVP